MKKGLLIFVLLGLMASVFAREVKVSVTDAELEIPLEGVKLKVKGKSQKTFITDENGFAVVVMSDKTETVEA